MQPSNQEGIASRAAAGGDTEPGLLVAERRHRIVELVREHGVAALGPVVLLAGLIQVVAGLCKVGVWFRMTSPAP